METKALNTKEYSSITVKLSDEDSLKSYRDMKKSDLSNKEISDYTGLSIEEIEKRRVITHLSPQCLPYLLD